MGNTGCGYTQEELVPIVAELAEKYTGFEHSSVTYERAQLLMGAVIYCVRASKTSADEPEKAALVSSGQKPAAKEAYELGLQSVRQKAEKLRELYHEVLPEFESYGLECLHDTVVKGIPAFLQNYDIRFAPQDTILTLDYPVLENLRGVCGVDAVLKFMQCICLEQKFLKMFDRAAVIGILKSYHTEYESLIENVSAIVLTNMLEHMLLKKPMKERKLCEKDYLVMGEILAGKSVQETEALLEGMLDSVIDEYFEGDSGLCAYLRLSIRDLAVRMKNREVQ